MWKHNANVFPAYIWGSIGVRLVYFVKIFSLHFLGSKLTIQSSLYPIHLTLCSDVTHVYPCDHCWISVGVCKYYAYNWFTHLYHCTDLDEYGIASRKHAFSLLQYLGAGRLTEESHHEEKSVGAKTSASSSF